MKVVSSKDTDEGETWITCQITSRKSNKIKGVSSKDTDDEDIWLAYQIREGERAREVKE